MRIHCLIPFLAAVLVSPLQAHEGEERLESAGGDQLGKVDFPISCNGKSQAEFNRAVAVLHSFYYPDAVKSFARIAEADPDCAMASWGVAMSLWYPLWYPPTREALTQGSAAVERAKAAASKTRREQDYIAAIETFYRDFEGRDLKTRARAYAEAMQQLHERYPDDGEAAAFYALALQAIADPNDKTYSKQLASAEVLEKLYVEQPDHPGVAHYLIHAYDYPELAPRALKAARHYGDIAPAMPHALHMPSHTYIALGLWDDSIQSNLAANASAKRLGWIQEELHTMDYLVYAYLQQGQDSEALDVARRMAAISTSEKRTLALDYAIAAGPARYALERRQWTEAAALTPAPSAFPAALAVSYYARALGAARSRSIEEARINIAKLEALRDGLERSGQSYWAKQIELQRLSAVAWTSWAEGKVEEALEQMRAAVDMEDSSYKSPVMPAYMLPARELLGDMLLESKRPDQALAQYEASMRAAPNRFNTLYGAARAASAAGDSAKAKQYYAQLLQLCDKSNSDRPELRQAKSFLASL